MIAPHPLFDRLGSVRFLGGSHALQMESKGIIDLNQFREDVAVYRILYVACGGRSHWAGCQGSRLDKLEFRESGMRG